MKFQTFEQARTRFAENRTEAEALCDAADANPDHPGKFTAEQQQKFDELVAEQEAILKDWPAANRRVAPQQPATPEGRRPAPSRPRGTAAVFRNPASGQPVYGLRHDEPLGDGGQGVGEIASAILRGDVSSLPGDLRQAVTTGGDGGGSYMLAPEVSNRVIDLARSASVVMRAGAVTVPMQTSELQLLRVLTDPTLYARREGASVTGSKPTFGTYTLRAKMYAAIVPVTLEMLEDSANGPEVIEQTLRSALGLAVDQASLTGAGGADILGITVADGTNEETSVGTPTNYDEVSDAVGAIFDANYDGEPSDLSWIANPRDLRTYDKLKDSTNQPLMPTPWAGALRRLSTTSLAASAGATEMIVGRFSELLVGMRTSGVVIDVLDAGTVTDDDSSTINAVSEFYRFIRARVRLDAVMMRPDWFTVLRGVTNT